MVAAGRGCCGALTHHMGQRSRGPAVARANIDAWTREIDGGGLDAVVINASGCGTTVKDYGFMLREDRRLRGQGRADLGAGPGRHRASGRARACAGRARRRRWRVAYHSACSLQHGQQITSQPKAAAAPRRLHGRRDRAEGHLCCGSAGTYNLLQPEIAGAAARPQGGQHRARPAPDVIAAGNIGCITQIASGTAMPIVHTVELLDWATGGPRPPALARFRL